jgi:hypothetical protein
MAIARLHGDPSANCLFFRLSMARHDRCVWRRRDPARAGRTESAINRGGGT